MAPVGATPPRVSVCIPTYQGAQTVGAAIASVLGQTHRDLELIVVDDHSTDATEAQVRRFADPRLRYLRNACNLGPEGNWNRCLSLTAGRYIKLLPHDDVLAPDCLERQVAVLDADHAERLALVFCARQVLAPDGRVLMRRGFPGAATGRLASRAVTSACVRRGTNLIGEPGAVLFRRALSQRVGGFDASQPYVIDLDYWIRLLAQGDAAYDEQALVGFRIGASAWTARIGRRQAVDFRQMVQRLSARGLLQPGRIDRWLGRITPTLNGWARRAVYHVHARG